MVGCEVGAGADQDFFQAAYVINRAQGFALAVGRGDGAQVENGIADQLAGAVERHVAAAIGFEYLDTALGKSFGRSQDVGALALRPRVMTGECSSSSRTSPMLAVLAQFDQALLQAQAGGVIDGAELEDGDQNRSPRISRIEHGSEKARISYSSIRDYEITRLHVKSVRSQARFQHALIAIPYTLLEASSMASASVGWAWIVHIRSSTVASSSMATTASAISSVACGPMMCTPRISP